MNNYFQLIYKSRLPSFSLCNNSLNIEIPYDDSNVFFITIIGGFDGLGFHDFLCRLSRVASSSSIGATLTNLLVGG